MLDGNPSVRKLRFLSSKRFKFIRALRPVLSPLALGLSVLALAVALWGVSRVNAKCSRPQARVPAARLWIEHRFGFAIVPGAAAAHAAKVRIFAQAGADAALIQSCASFSHYTLPAVTVAAHSRALPFYHSAIPLRSPPSFTSL